MKLTTILACAIAMPLATNGLAFQAAPKVYIRGKEVFVLQQGGGEPKQLTDDGRPKGNLTVSPSGLHIAFIRESSTELADIIVMHPDGSDPHEIRFRPEGARPFGMRYVESLGWMSEGRMLATGSLDPSTCEYAVIDVATGKYLYSYLTDGFSLSVSPDGSHVAYVGQMPHFMLETSRRPQFCLDDECQFGQPYRGYLRSGAHLEYPSTGLWSPDGSAVAVVAEDFDSHRQSIVVKRVGGQAVELTSPSEPGISIGIGWQGGALVVTTANSKWRLEPGKAVLEPVK